METNECDTPNVIYDCLEDGDGPNMQVVDVNDELVYTPDNMQVADVNGVGCKPDTLQVVDVNNDLGCKPDNMQVVDVNNGLGCKPDKLQVVDVNNDLESKPEPTNHQHLIEDHECLKEARVLRKKKTYTCFVCTRRFNQNAGRYNHMKKVHNIQPSEKANVRCLEKGCRFLCSYKEKLQLHLSEEHGINMDVAIQTFNCLQDFLRWKDQFERQEKSRFVKKSGSRTREEGVRVAYYYCSRSGTYVRHNNITKKTKKKGTSKSNNHCTASITVLELADGKVEVRVCSTHYGHDNDLQHLRLTQTEKFEIAEQLCRGLPRDLVLDNVRSSMGSDVDRIHLITLKDIKNIEKAYGIQSASNENTNNMFYNLNVWIANIMESEHNPVLHFNEEGVYNTSGHHVTLILLTTGQLELLNRYGRGGIYYVSTFVTKNKQPFNNQSIRPSSIFVTTLMLVGDLNEAVPVSFMVSDNVDAARYKVFFQNLKDRLPDITAQAVLTDDKKEIFEMWCSVFSEEPFHLWSNRFVDSDWRENLVSIPDEDIQVSIYEKLYMYLESTDREKLETTLESYVNDLQENIMTNKFGSYFAHKYVGSQEMWAGCYGKRIVKVSAQLNMEHLCNELEEITHRRHWDRNFIVKIVQHLLKSISERQCFRQARIQRQTQELPFHHNLAININPESVLQESDCRWRVESFKDQKKFVSNVNHQDNNCEPVSCSLYCSKCNICAHQFNCSCKVYAYDRTMCKHIHAVALKFFPRGTEPKSEPVDENEKSSENPDECSVRELTNPEVILLNANLWRKGRKAKRKQIKSEETTHENNLLPKVAEVLQNKSVGLQQKENKNNSKNPGECSLRESTNPELPNANLWRKERKSKRKQISSEESKHENNSLQNQNESVQPEKRKRGRPRKNEKKNTQNTDVPTKATTGTSGTVKKRKRKEKPSVGAVSDGGGNSSCMSLRPHRVNILRKFKKK